MLNAHLHKQNASGSTLSAGHFALFGKQLLDELDVLALDGRFVALVAEPDRPVLGNDNGQGSSHHLKRVSEGKIGINNQRVADLDRKLGETLDPLFGYT